LIFSIYFNDIKFNDDDFLFKELGAYWVSTGATKYPPYEQLEIEVKDFRELERLLEKVDKHYDDIYSAVISFNPPTLYLDSKI
jgi:hypothetical protein